MYAQKIIKDLVPDEGKNELRALEAVQLPVFRSFEESESKQQGLEGQRKSPLMNKSMMPSITHNMILIPIQDVINCLRDK